MTRTPEIANKRAYVGPRQADLIDVFGAESTVSEVLSGKRDLAKSHIQKLSRRFHVSPELFF